MYDSYVWGLRELSGTKYGSQSPAQWKSSPTMGFSPWMLTMSSMLLPKMAVTCGGWGIGYKKKIQFEEINLRRGWQSPAADGESESAQGELSV